jgi:serine/threonine protein kinase/alpha-tubulin suppressor-like RCC1 family protein
MTNDAVTASHDAAEPVAALTRDDAGLDPSTLDPATLGDLEADYELLEELGRGGTAVVYRARDRELGREVAVKVVRPAGPAEIRPAAGDAARSPAADEPLARLLREARAVARLQHPNIVGVYAIRRPPQGGLALVMELITGRTLKDVLRDEGPLSPEHARRVLRAVAEALRFSHRHGIVHRDVKPENIFLDAANDRVLLSDFGIARVDEGDTRLTRTGTTLGTPAYMSPEQIAGIAVDGRSDLYSLGLVAWEMLTGQQPWEGATFYELLDHQRRDTLPPIDAVRPADRERVPLPLQYAIERMLQKEPGARWAGVEEVLPQLEDGAELPEDYASWLHVFRRRVDAHRKSRLALASSTQRFDVPSGATPAAALPAWVEEVNARRSRWRVAALAGVAIAAATALVLWRGGTRAPRNVATIASGEADRGAVEVPVTPPVTSGPTDSLPTPAPVVDSASAPPPATPTPPTPTAPATPPPPPTVAPRAAAPAPVSTAAPAPVAPAVVASVAPERFTLAVGGHHTCALGSSGRAYCWGSNDRGQLGATDPDGHATPDAVSGSLQFVQIVAGVSHSCALTRVGDAYCWGSDDHGELGDATTSSRDAPVRVAGGLHFRALRAGRSHTCGVTGDGAVACWGANASGQIGDGTTGDRTIPVLASAGETRFTAVAAGWRHTCALSTEGAAFCWGANDDGQLGDGTRTNRATPVAVAGRQRFVDIAAGSAHTCAVTAGGVAYCWGRNAYGQLGTGATDDRTTPTRVDSPLRFAAVAAGSVHSCGRTAAGAVACWGRNVYGQLGDGTTTDRATPVRVPGTFASLDATGAHTCGVTSAGGVSCWGYNLEGQLGDGTRTHRGSPTSVEKALP